MIAGERDDRRRIVAVRLIELVVIVLGLAEAVDDIAEVEEEQWPVLGVVVGEIAHQLVGDEILIGRAAGIAGVAGRVKDQLFVGFYLVFQVGLLDVEHIGEAESGLRQAAGRRERQRREFMRLIERVDLLVDRTVGRMLDFELGWVRGRCRLAKNRTVQFGRSDIVDGMSCWRCFWLTTSWRAGHGNPPRAQRALLNLVGSVSLA